MQVKKWLLSAFMIVLAPLCFVACGESNTENYISAGYIEVINTSTGETVEAGELYTVAMSLETGEPYQIECVVQPSNATNTGVNYSSSNTDVATVDENGLVTAVGVGTTIITITSQDRADVNISNIQISVFQNAEKLTAPTNVHYDEASDSIVWNPVYVSNSNYVPSYVLTITTSEGTTTTSAIPTTTYDEFLPDTVYTVSVSALGDGIMYTDSDASSTYTFAQMSTPSEYSLVVEGGDNNTNRIYFLRFKMSALTTDISDYNVRVTNVSGIMNDNDDSLWQQAIADAEPDPENSDYMLISVPRDLSTNIYAVSIQTLADSENNYFASEYSTSIRLSRLPAPTNLSYAHVNDTEQLTWSTVQYATTYMIYVSYNAVNGGTIDRYISHSASSSTPTMYDFANMVDRPNESEYVSFDIYMYALAPDANISGVYYLDSDISDLPAQQQLRSVEEDSITISPNDESSLYTINWGTVDNAGFYEVYIGPSTSETSSDANISSLDKLVYTGSATSVEILYNQTLNGEPLWTVGYNSLKIVAYPSNEGDDSSRYVASAPTLYSQKFIKIATPSDFGVSNGQLTWSAVDSATQYIIYFNNENTSVTVDTSLGQTAYTYEPTATEMPDASTSYFAYIMAINNDNDLIINSDESQGIEITRFGRPSNLRVENGELTWDRIDQFKNTINTNTFEVQVTNRNGDTVIPDFTTQEQPLNFEDYLGDLITTDRYFVFKVRAINSSSSAYINGDWSDAITTYQLPTPTNVRIENGVITWDAFDDTNVEANHSGIRYSLMVGSQEYGITSSPILDITSTSALITGLTASTMSYSIRLQVTIQQNLSGDFKPTVVGDDSVFIINSNYSEAFNVRQLPTPSNVTIRDTTLYWSASNTSLNEYRIELYRVNVDETSGNRTRDSEPSYTTIVSPSNPSSPSWDFSVALGLGDESTEFDFSSGAYQFVIYAIGTNFNAQDSSSSYGYLTSYASSYVEVFKLDTPTLDVKAGVVSWNAVYSELNGVSNRINTYSLSIARQTENGGYEYFNIVVNNATSTTLDDLPSSFYDTPLYIRIKAVSSYDRVYDSELSANYTRPSDANPTDDRVYTVYKPAQIAVDADNMKMDGMVITWPEALGVTTTYTVYIYEYSSTLPIDSTNPRYTLTASTNSIQLPDLASGEYFVRILRKGYDTGLDRYLDSKLSDPYYLERFARPIGVTMTRSDGGQGDPVLTWRVVSASDLMRFRIDIVSSTGTVSYFVPASEGVTSYSLNLNGQAQNSAGGSVDIEKFDAGTLRFYIQAVLLDEGSTIEDGKTVHLLYSQQSAVYSAYVYSAPSITFQDDGNIYLNKTNQFDKGTQLIFTPVTYANETYSLDSGAQVNIQLASGVNTFNMNNSNLEAGVMYQVQLKALGNSSNLIESSWEISNFIVQKLEVFTPNTVSGGIENEASFDGWYTKDGTVWWNKVEGVTRYDALLSNNDESIMRTAFSVPASSEASNYSGSITGLDAGQYNLQFTLIGGASSNTITVDGLSYNLGYVSSEISTKQPFVKLSAPNDDRVEGRSEAYSRIVNGEFDFGIRDEVSGAWTDDTGATAYILSVNDEWQYTYALDGTAQSFDAKAEFESAGRYYISLYSVGNTWTGSSSETIYITSDSYGQFTILYGGKIEDFNVTNGALNWEAITNGSTAGYDIEYRYSGNDEPEPIRNLTVNTYSFDEDGNAKGSTFDYIKVRYSGDIATSQGATQGYVNTEWSEELNNIIKLPDIEYNETYQNELFINDWGQLAWRYGANYQDKYTDFDVKMHLTLDIRYLGTTVGGYTEGWDVDRAPDGTGTNIGNYFNVPTINISQENIDTALTNDNNPWYGSMDGVLKYNITGYVAGTVDQVTPSSQGGGMIYLNSDSYLCSAYKLDNATSFGLDTENGPGLRLVWDIAECGIVGFDPEASSENQTVSINGDVVLFAYTERGSDEIKYKKVTSEAVDNIALWNVTTFERISLTVLSSQGNAFGSNTLEVQNINFNFFDSGQGTVSDPFIIKSGGNSSYSALEQLELAYWIPEVFFALEEDIELEDLEVIQQTSPDATSNYPIPAEFYTGEADEIYISRNLTGGFDGRNHTISNIQVSGAESYGWWQAVTDTELVYNEYDDTEIDENNAFDSRGGVITNLTMEAYSIDVSSLSENSYSGLFAEQNFGLITNCISDGASLADRHNPSDPSIYIPVFSGQVSNSNIYVGGIAGMTGVFDSTPEGHIIREYSGFGHIESSQNFLDITLESIGVQNFEVFVGGIAGYNLAGSIIDCVNGSDNMTSLSNQAEITGYRAGGIVGTIDSVEMTDEDGTIASYTYAYTSGNINYGTITTTRRQTSEGSSYSSAGGIVGTIYRGFVTYDMNFGTVTTTGISSALGGIAGAQNQGAYILSCVNIGEIRYNEYYGSNTPTQITAGSILGIGDFGNVYFCYYVENGIYMNRSDGGVTQLDRLMGDASTSVNTGSTFRTQSFAGLDIAQFLTNASTKINQDSILISTEPVDNVVYRIDGLRAQFSLVSGQNPTIEWV